MHTFDIGQAISGGFKAFGEKALPLILITLVGGIIMGIIQVVIVGSMFSGLGAAEVNSDGSIEIESRINDGMENYFNILQNADQYEGNEEDAAREIAEGFGFDYDQLEDITADGEVSGLEALSAYSGSSFDPFGGVSWAGLFFGWLLGAVVSLFLGIALTTAALDAVFERKFELSNITKNFSKLPSILVFAILMVVLAIIMIIPLLGAIAYFIIGLMVSQAIFIIIEENMGAIESMKKSKQLMVGNKLKLFGLNIILGLVGGIFVMVTLGFGALVFAPAVACIMAHVYKQLSQGPIAAAADKVKQAVS